MKKICFLLENAIRNDIRVLKMIQTISEQYIVHLYYCNGSEDDARYFNKNVHLFAFDRPHTFKTKVLSHSFFYREFNFLAHKVLHSKEHYDLVWANDLTTMGAALLIKNVLSCPLVYDAHEIYNETLNQQFPAFTNSLKSKLLQVICTTMKKLGIAFEQKALQQTDHFITVNTSLAKYFKQKYLFSAPVSVVMNYPTIQNKQQTNKHNFRAQYNWNTKDKVIIFQGTLNRGRALMQLVQAMTLVPPIFKLVLLGEGPLVPEIKNKIKALQLEDSVKMAGYIAPEHLTKYTLGADYGINLLEPINLSKKMTTATKLFEYILAGLPSINSDIVENRLLLEAHVVGRLTANDVDSIADAIQKLESEPFPVDIQNKMKTAADVLVWETQNEKISKIVGSLV